jgi:hypothetical protein
MKRLAIWGAVTLAVAILQPASVHAQGETALTAGGGGVFPADVSYSGVPLNALKFGIGVTIDGGAAEGQFHATLIGVSVLGLEQYIEVEGKASTSSVASSDTVTFSGQCTVDMGDGIALPEVPFTVVVATNAEGSGNLTLTLGSTNLPAATMNEGSMTIK